MKQPLTEKQERQKIRNEKSKRNRRRMLGVDGQELKRAGVPPTPFKPLGYPYLTEEDGEYVIIHSDGSKTKLRT